MEMEDADDAWASLLPDLLLDIFRRLEATAVVRCGGACKPWRRTIIGNASSLRPCPDRYNPNLLLGFFHYICRSIPRRNNQAANVASDLPVISFTAVDTRRCESLRLPSFASAGGVDLSMCHTVWTSRDGFLLLRRRLDFDDLRLWNPMAGECTSLPMAPIEEDECMCSYALLTGYDLSPSSSSAAAVRVLAMAGPYMFSPVEDRLTYQVFTTGNNGFWGPAQRSEAVKNMGPRMLIYGFTAVVGRDAVYWLAGIGSQVTSAVGLDVCTGRAWTTELPEQCQSYHLYSRPFTLTTSGNGRLSLVHPLPDHDIQVWVLVGDDVVDAMEWTLQHKISIDIALKREISIDMQNQVPYPRDRMLDCNYLKVVCPRSGFLFIMLSNSLQLRIDLRSGVHPAVQCVGKRSPSLYYPYEMDWSTYISKMKNF